MKNLDRLSTNLKILAAVLLAGLLYLAFGWGLAPLAAAQALIPVGCTNGAGDVNGLINAINQANRDPNEDTIVLAQNCTYTLPGRSIGNINGLPILQSDIIVEGNGAKIRRSPLVIPFRLLNVSNAAKVTLKNLTLERGLLTSEGGGAIFATEKTQLVIENVKFVANTAPKGGAMLALGEVSIADSRFQGNRALQETGGGLLVTGRLALTNTDFINNSAEFEGGGVFAETVTIKGGRFENNKANLGGGAVVKVATIQGTRFIGNQALDAGGMSILDQGVIIEGYFERNRATDVGGGIFFAAAGTSLTLRATDFVSNTAIIGGGLKADAPLTIIGGRFERNVAAVGGGLKADAPLTITGGRFERNVATVGGGGLAVEGGLTMTHTTLISNSAPSGGGAISAGTATLAQNVFIENSAQTGAGLIVSGNEHEVNQISNNLWVDNKVLPGSEGAAAVIVALGSAESIIGGAVKILHNTIVSSGPTNADGVFIGVQPATVQNNIITNHNFGLVATRGTTPVVEHNLYFGNTDNEVGPITSRNSLSTDPLFVAPAGGDYRLQADSKAIDTGLDAGIRLDFDGQPRPQGEGFDIGAYEFAALNPPEPSPIPEPDPAPEPDPNPNPGGFSVFLPLVVK